MKTNGLVDTANRTAESDQHLSWAHAYERRMRRFNLKVVSVAFAGFWAYKRARRAQQQIPQGAKNPQGKLKQAIYKLADSKVIRFLKWLVDDPG